MNECNSRANKHNRNSKSSISATVSIYVGEIYVAQKDAVQLLLLFSTLLFFFVSLWVQLCLVDLTIMAVKLVKQISFRTKFLFLNNKKRNFPKLLCCKMKKIICRGRERTRLCLFRLNWWIAAVCKHLQLHLHHWPSSNINSFHYPGKWSVGLEKAIFS